MLVMQKKRRNLSKNPGDTGETGKRQRRNKVFEKL